METKETAFTIPQLERVREGANKAIKDVFARYGWQDPKPLTLGVVKAVLDAWESDPEHFDHMSVIEGLSGAISMVEHIRMTPAADGLGADLVRLSEHLQCLRATIDLPT